MDARRQAAEEIIMLKQAYKKDGNQEQNMANAERANQLRQEHGLSDDMFGAGVSLADSLTNFHREFSNRQEVNQAYGQMQTPQYEDRPRFNAQAEFDRMNSMFEDSSSAFYDSQKAQFGSMLQQQIQNLEMAYAEAIENGEISVRDAQRDFEKQKAAIEQSAYQQAQMTKAYGNEMGISHSQQMIGLQQGDAQRAMSMQNENMVERDRRVSDIKSRLNTIKQQKDLQITGAELQHGYNLAGADAQARQMYADNMGQFASQNYFTQMGMQHDWDAQSRGFEHERMLQGDRFSHDRLMQDMQFAQQFGVLEREQEYNRENMQSQFEYGKQMASHESNLRISEMAKGHEFKLDEIATMFQNDLVRMAKQHGYDKALTGMQISGQLQAASMNAAAKINAMAQQRKWEKEDLLARINPNSPEYKAMQQDFDMQTEQMVKQMYAQEGAKFQMDSIFGNPNLPKPGESIAPKAIDYKKAPYFNNVFGNLANKLSGFDAANTLHKDQKAAVDAVDRFLGNSSYGGVDIRPYAPVDPGQMKWYQFQPKKTTTTKKKKK